jgi:hypothetical protein
MTLPRRWQERFHWVGWGGVQMNSHQHAAIEHTRIAWHYHQFEHCCYGQDCAEDRRLYSAYARTINGDLAKPSPQPPARGTPVPDK